MKKESYSAKKAMRAIENTVNEMLNLFLLLKSRNEELLKLRNELKCIDENNPDYFEILHDHRENNKMNLKTLILFLSFIIDFLLLYTTLDILSKQFGWWDIMKVIVPFTLIIGEVIISYFSAIQLSYEGKSSHIIRNLQYYVLPLLVGFSLFAILYHAGSYNKDIDSLSFLSYMTFAVLIKILLLISSVMLHLWLIKNAEEIAEANAYMRYKWHRSKIRNKIEKIESDNTTKYYARFTNMAHKYLRDSNSFERMFPESHFDYASTMPQELIDGINKVMGRVVIVSKNKGNNLNKTS